MLRKLEQIGFACGLGAFIGALLALELTKHLPNTPHLWLVGLAVGGFVGYLTKDLKEVGRGLVHAWREVQTEKFKDKCAKFRDDFGFVMYAWIGGLGPVLTFFAVLTLPSKEFYFPSNSDAVRLTFMILFIAGVFGYIVAENVCRIKVALREEFSEEVVVRKMALFGNPIVFPVFALYTLVVFVFKFWVAIFKKIPAITRGIGVFLKTIFIYIHSRERMLCLVDSIIGSLVGYYFGSPFIGAFAGMVIAIAHYYLISIKLLKLQPA